MSTLETRAVRTALFGFGVSGRVFHAPLIEADPAFSLDVIVTSDPGRARQAASLYPRATVVAEAADAFALSDKLDLVVLGTPPRTHFDLAGAAIDCELHVVVDKPFVPNIREGRDLIQRAKAARVLLTVFHNRRWDADFLTLQRLLGQGALGKVHSFESRFEWWRPQGFGNWRDSTPASEGGGILHDLGAHLIDQALQLFGPVEKFRGEIARRKPGPGADDEAFVSLQHASGVRSRLWMNGAAAQVGQRFHVLGSEAGYTKWGLDSQESTLDSGVLPTDPSYGVELQTGWGSLGIDGHTVPVPPERGDYPEFYRRLATAAKGEGSVPVDPVESLAVLSIIDAIRTPV